jgi:hypothetical protein
MIVSLGDKMNSDTSDLTFEQRLSLYENFRSYVRHEDGLINNRMTWLLSIHGFLYATYGFTIQKRLEVTEKITLTLAQGKSVWNQPFREHIYLRCEQLPALLLQLEIFLIVLSLVGLAISVAAYVSIDAATKALFNLREIFSKNDSFKPTSSPDQLLELSLKTGRATAFLPGLAGGGLQQSVRKGRYSSVIIPILMAFSWLIILTLSTLNIAAAWSTDYRCIMPLIASWVGR